MDAKDVLLPESRQKKMAAVVDAIPTAPEISAFKLNVIGMNGRNSLVIRWIRDKGINLIFIAYPAELIKY